MRLVRTFHPVGHGAFYTEQFYGDYDYSRENCLFTAVYDCGSKLNDVELYRIINQALHGHHIDALFISHMHRDHISGVKYLLEHYGCNKIFLPQLTNSQLTALLVHNVISSTETQNVTPLQALEDDAMWMLRQCYSSENTNSELRSRIVTIPYAKSFEAVREVNPESFRAIETLGGGSTLNINESVRFDVSSDFNWVYVPKNKECEIKINFKNLMNGVVTNDGKINFEELAHKCSDSTIWDQIVKIYNKKFAGSAANEYSMTVYSGLLKPLDRRIHIMDVECCHDCECCCNFPNCEGYRHRCYYRIGKPGCLYMGDFVATNENVDELINCLNPFFPYAEVIQVPHHGSERLHKGTEHYGFQLFDNCKVGVFSSKFGQYNDVPSPYVIQALKTNRVCPKIVTQKSDTMLKMIYHIM